MGDKLKYQLPAGPLSYTQFSSWEADPEKYISRYIIGEPYFESDGLLFGRRFSEALEAPDDCRDPHLMYGIEKLDILDQVEYKHKELFPGGLPTVAKYDSISMMQAKYIEYKTGSADYPWTETAVWEHTQMWFYTAVMFVHTGCVFDSELQWLETEKCLKTADFPEGIRFTGRCEKYAFRPTMAATEAFISRMYKVANEIGYTVHLREAQEIPELMDAQLLFEFMEAYRTYERARALVKRLECTVKDELQLNDLRYLELYGGRLKITAKGNLTTKIFEE